MDVNTEEQIEMKLVPPNYVGEKKPRPKVSIKELMESHQDDEILRLTQQFVNDVDLENEWCDPNTLKLSCIKCRQDFDRRYVNCFLAYDRGEAIGFLVGVASPAFHRPGIVAEQKLWYVTPDRRGGAAARKLIGAFERWARLNGATQLFTGTANLRYSERTSKLLEKLGYARVGSTHVKEIR